nr:PREDICTED: uncharacterized protein LOC106702678 [Latimeria chalumnae]|eukprot:XP_014341085.1 PREDICTED: uncharacterized protein LOC106702678 [Latimeria chalumnae]
MVMADLLDRQDHCDFYTETCVSLKTSPVQSSDETSQSHSEELRRVDLHREDLTGSDTVLIEEEEEMLPSPQLSVLERVIPETEDLNNDDTAVARVEEEMIPSSQPPVNDVIPMSFHNENVKENSAAKAGSDKMTSRSQPPVKVRGGMIPDTEGLKENSRALTEVEGETGLISLLPLYSPQLESQSALEYEGVITELSTAKKSPTKNPLLEAESFGSVVQPSVHNHITGSNSRRLQIEGEYGPSVYYNGSMASVPIIPSVFTDSELEQEGVGLTEKHPSTRSTLFYATATPSMQKGFLTHQNTFSVTAYKRLGEPDRHMENPQDTNLTMTSVIDVPFVKESPQTYSNATPPKPQTNLLRLSCTEGNCSTAASLLDISKVSQNPKAPGAADLHLTPTPGTRKDLTAEESLHLFTQTSDMTFSITQMGNPLLSSLTTRDPHTDGHRGFTDIYKKPFGRSPEGQIEEAPLGSVPLTPWKLGTVQPEKMLLTEKRPPFLHFMMTSAVRTKTSRAPVNIGLHGSPGPRGPKGNSNFKTSYKGDLKFLLNLITAGKDGQIIHRLPSIIEEPSNPSFHKGPWGRSLDLPLTRVTELFIISDPW